MTTPLVASVRQRLLNLSRERGEDFNLVLTRYANERFLYRLAQSAYADRFVLKGAMLFTVWTGQAHRPTRDVDMLGYGNSADEVLLEIFRDICEVEVEADGITLEGDSLRVEEIRRDQDYQGKRVRLNAWLGSARIRLQIDIGFGDVVFPSAQCIDYPTMLDFPAPALVVYSKEAFIAEKFQAMVALGFANSRMKDFYDIWMMSREFSFERQVLGRAMRATFGRRQTAIPTDTPLALSAEFGSDPGKARQWRAFLARNGLEPEVTDFVLIVDELREFLLPSLWETGGDDLALPGEKRDDQ